MAHPEPTMVIFKLSPEIAMLSAPFRFTHPLPLVPPFLLAQNPFLRTLQDMTSPDETFMPDISGYIRERTMVK